MTGVVQELYTPVPIAANGNNVCKGKGLGGFICTTEGTMTITDSVGTILTMVVAISTYYPLPIANRGTVSITVTLSGGAAGCLLVA